MRIIRGKYGRRRFDVPHNITARPTTDFARENIFNVIENIEDLEDKTALDLFAGTGAVSYEFLSRGCREVTAVEKAAVQIGFIKSVKEKLGDENLRIIKGDVFKFVATASQSYDIIFADPPYDHPRFAEIPELILDSKLVHEAEIDEGGEIISEGSLVIIEHSGKYNFSSLPGFVEQRIYGSVNFSIFRVTDKNKLKIITYISHGQ
ncbi:MAG: RsmD family RNA methyltransferase [Prevotella sp.]|nr:RsmD family RNA methyltransferase [Bacteroides sp.]MCM1366293.1 RsmD family RNA methyltransferase [Prevotella sp.]MCM1437097.1 RsmD family RNA methyltransferase [Prevotella sp.]